MADSAVFQTENGPVLLDEGVRIMDMAYLEGPVYVGPGSVITEHASLKENVSIGHTCKIGGEVQASVIEPYSNKQHHGFLGHAWVGSWVNLSAGTSNSNFKSTYDTVEINHQGEQIDSESQFMGCLIGDYSRTGVNTSIRAGTIIGISSVVCGYVAENVPSFCNYARTLGQVTEFSVQESISTQKRMFERRDVDQTSMDRELLRRSYELAQQNEHSLSNGG